MSKTVNISKDPEASTASKAVGWAILAGPSGLAALGVIPWLAAFLIPVVTFSVMTVLLLTIATLVLRSADKRPQRPEGDGWYWNRALNKWCRKPGHYADRALAAAAPRIEDEIDAAVAAWKTVYGEDIGYNEHAVTLEWLGSLYRSNDLTSSQLADACESVEWVTWALAQPEQNEMLKHLGGPAAAAKVPGMRPVGEHSNSLRERRIKRESTGGGSWLTTQQITEKLAELETRAADTLSKVEAGTLSINEARHLIEGTDDMVGYLGAQRQAITGEPYPFDHAAYQAHVDRFTAMARPAIAQADRRVSEHVFEKMRQQLGMDHDQHQQAVLEADTCDGCATMLYSTDKGMGEQSYCDGSHTRERSLADTIHETATEGW